MLTPGEQVTSGLSAMHRFHAPSWVHGFVVPWLFVFVLCAVPHAFNLAYGVETWSWTQFVKLLSWSAMAVIPHLLLGGRKFYLLLLTIALVALGVVQIFHVVTFHGPLSVASLFVIFETNTGEASQFLQMYLSPLKLAGYAFYIGLAIGAWYFLRAPRLRAWHRLDMSTAATALVVPLLLVQPDGPGDDIYKLLRTEPPLLAGPFGDLIAAKFDFDSQVKAYREEAAKRKSGGTDLKAVSLPLAQNQVYVLVMGESTDRNHMQLYGYGRETSPQLLAMKDELYVYTDVITAFTHTQPALKANLTFAGTEMEKRYHEVYSVLDVARAAGFHTSWISNQAPVGVWDNEVSVLANTADEPTYVNLAGDSNSAFFFTSPDERVLVPLRERLSRQDGKNKFIIVHLMGAHGVYANRYPESWDYFKSGSDITIGKRDFLDAKKIEIINHYDNAVRYNDYVVAEIVKTVKQASMEQNLVSSVLYLSDHGEEVFDTQDFYGHDYTRVARHHVEIPFLIWTSDQFKVQRPEIDRWMRDRVHTPYLSAHLIHTLIDMMGVQSPLQNPKRSILAAAFRPEVRMVYGKNYDTEILAPLRRKTAVASVPHNKQAKVN